MVVLCDGCSDAVIDRHPRLYRAMHRHEPSPGSMPACVDCRHREGLGCTHPSLKANGGDGLAIESPAPITVCIDGTKGGRRCGWTERWYSGPAVCRARELSARVDGDRQPRADASAATGDHAGSPTFQSG